MSLSNLLKKLEFRTAVVQNKNYSSLGMKAFFIIHFSKSSETTSLYNFFRCDINSGYSILFPALYQLPYVTHGHLTTRLGSQFWPYRISYFNCKCWPLWTLPTWEISTLNAKNMTSLKSMGANLLLNATVHGHFVNCCLPELLNVLIINRFHQFPCHELKGYCCQQNRTKYLCYAYEKQPWIAIDVVSNFCRQKSSGNVYLTIWPVFYIEKRPVSVFIWFHALLFTLLPLLHCFSMLGWNVVRNKKGKSGYFVKVTKMRLVCCNKDNCRVFEREQKC